jgi:hypothetical protein
MVFPDDKPVHCTYCIFHLLVGGKFLLGFGMQLMGCLDWHRQVQTMTWKLSSYAQIALLGSNNRWLCPHLLATLSKPDDADMQ